MLDLLSVAGQLRRMRSDLARLDDERGPRLEAAASAWRQAVALGPALRDRVLKARTSWLVAEPLEELRAYDVVPPGSYRVAASDGSQVFPDRHEMAQCFLVNVGLVQIDYRAYAAAMTSAPTLCWLPADVYPLVGGMRQEADGRVVAARRFAAECDALTGAAASNDLLLTDGTLLLWWLDPDPDRLRALPPDDVKSRTLASLNAMTAASRDAGSVPVGYLSAPRSTDVVSMLKVVLCTEEPVDCDRCPYTSGKKAWGSRPAQTDALRMLPAPERPCEEVETIADAALFARLLHPGQRSGRFRSSAQVAQAYEAPIDFVYLHTGAEIARLEFPAWVTPDGLDSMCGMVADQCDKGLGYPVALAEAHEQGVVRGNDRRAFQDLLRRQGAGPVSAKLSRKRLSVL